MLLDKVASHSPFASSTKTINPNKQQQSHKHYRYSTKTKDVRASLKNPQLPPHYFSSVIAIILVIPSFIAYKITNHKKLHMPSSLLNRQRSSPICFSPPPPAPPPPPLPPTPPPPPTPPLATAAASTTLMRDKAVAALRAHFVGDSLAMPAHWFYNTMDIDRYFPQGLNKFFPAPKDHPSSIMRLHSTSGGGRGSQESGDCIVGGLILQTQGKVDRWGIPNMHYHAGMPEGENTLNAYCSRVLLRNFAKVHAYEPSKFIADYIAMMTKDEHPDTYAESYHREFFKNYKRGKDPLKCAGVTHDTASIGGLVTLGPLAILQLIKGTSLADVKTICRQHLNLTHPDKLLANVSDAYIDVLAFALHAQKMDDVDNILPHIAQAATVIAGMNEKRLAAFAQKQDREVIGRYLSPACYIDGSWPAVLYFAYKYNNKSTFEALKANAMVGGDNVHRGAVLGTIMGAFNPNDESITTHFQQLVHAKEIDSEIHAAVDAALV